MDSSAVTITPDKVTPVTITPDAQPTESSAKAAWKASNRPKVQASTAFQASYDPDSSAKNFAANAGEGGTGVLRSALDVGKDLLSNPNWLESQPAGQRPSTAQKYLFDPADATAAKAKAAYGKGRYSEAAGYGAASAIPFAGPWAAGMGEQAGTGDISGAAGQLAGGMAAGSAGSSALQGAARTAVGDLKGLTDPLAWKEGLNEMSHQMLDKSANQAKRTLWDTRQKVSENVGNLINQISAKDATASPQGSINLSDLLPKIEEIANAYKAQDGRLPNFDKVAGRVSQANPNVSWYELHKLKSEVGDAAIAARDPADAAAVDKVRQAIDTKLTDRANELGAGTQNAAYKKQWSTLKSYEDKGVLGDLLGAKSGKEFFDIINDPKSSGPLGNMVKDLNNFGLPDDFRTKLKADHQDLYQYVTDAQKSGFGKIRVLMQHPIAGTAGFLGGKVLGGAVGSPMLGGIMGSVGAGSMVDRIMAAKNIRALGGPAPIEGEMGDLGKVKGEPTAPPTSTRSPILRDVTDALVSQGMKKADAAQAAQRGVAQFPDDFDKAFSTALRRPDKVQAVANAKQSKK